MLPAPLLNPNQHNHYVAASPARARERQLRAPKKCILRTPPYRLVMVNRIEFSAEPTDTYLMHVQYVRSFIAHVAFA